mmetsp:Transcript_738/g.747  ORF Transcript_738/g.747 Transcript_738/m.747 type:complete len:334 (+) Transcript_738:240-1241(+)
MGYVVYILLVLVQLAFSGWYIVGSLSLRTGADPFIFASYREIIASVLMLMFVFSRKVPITIDMIDVPRLTFIGVCSFLNIVGTILALQYISPSRYSLLQPLNPIIASSLSIIMGIEKLTLEKLIGAVIAVAGAYIVEIFSNRQAYEKDVTLGMVLTVIQCSGIACVIVFQVPLLQKYDSALVTLIYYSVGTFITIIICAIWSRHFEYEDFIFHENPLCWVALIYAAIFASFFTFNVYSWAGKSVSPSMITLCMTIQPVATSILSFLFLKQTVSILQGVGGLLVMCGLMLTIYSQQRVMEETKKLSETLYEPLVSGSVEEIVGKETETKETGVN